jgi:hypothetical protein
MGQKVVLVGSSSLKNSASFFSGGLVQISDHSAAGWTPTPENIEKVDMHVKQETQKGTKAFVFNLFGNIAVRFKQFNGTSALPSKSHGRYHLGGKITTCPSDLFKKII